MPHLILQLAFLIAVVFVIGCILGAIARKRKSASISVVVESKLEQEKVAEVADKKAVATVDSPAVEADVKDVMSIDEVQPTVEAKVVASKSAIDDLVMTVAQDDSQPHEAVSAAVDIPPAEPVIIIEEVPVKVGEPALLNAAREGKPDSLTKIKGIGPTLQRKLYMLGIYHYDQLAEWNADNTHWIGQQIKFPGRVEREEWVEQAIALVKLNTKEPSTKDSKKTSAAKANKKRKSVASTSAKAASVKASVKKAPIKTVKPKAKPTVDPVK